MKGKEKEFEQKQDEMELQRTELEEKYKLEIQVLDDTRASECKKLEKSKLEIRIIKIGSFGYTRSP